VPSKRIVVVACVTAAFVLASCGGSSNNSSSTTTSNGSTSNGSTAPSNGVDPNATEANPAGDIPDNQVYVAYTDARGPFSVKVPEGWGRRSSNGVVSFTDKLNTIALQVVDAPKAPTVASANASEVPTIARTAKHYRAGTTTTKMRAGGPAVLIEYQADGAPDPVTSKIVRLAVQRYEFWRNGKEAVVTLSGPVTADNVDPWNLVSNSFRWR
jgi:hypothetical protein